MGYSDGLIVNFLRSVYWTGLVDNFCGQYNGLI